MSENLFPQTPGKTEQPKKTPLAMAIVLALGGIILIWSEIWVSAAVVFWAIVGIAHASQLMTIILAVIISVPALWASWIIARLAIEAERDAGTDNPLSD